MSEQRYYFQKLEKSKQTTTEYNKPNLIHGNIKNKNVAGHVNDDVFVMSSVANRRLFFENRIEKEEEEKQQRRSRKPPPGSIQSHIVS